MYKRAYAYLRVSTFQQLDGQSLTGQEEEIRQYCAIHGIELVRVYSDEGKYGKSIAGRPQFQKMIQDIENLQEVDCVIVWKFSRFARNVYDSLSVLNVLQKQGVNLIVMKEGVDTGGPLYKMQFNMFATIAEMERENIREQTANGKKYTALSGGWNGGMAPYGYKLNNRQLVVDKEEAEVVKQIFEWYMESKESGYATVTARLNEKGIKPRQLKRLDRKAMQTAETEEKIYLPMVEDWYTSQVKNILDNPVYCGKIRYGYHKIETLEDGSVRRICSDDTILCEGKHEAIISEELWNKVQEKRKKSKKLRGRKDSKSESVNNVFNKVAKCPQCGGNMTSYASRHKNVKGEERKYHQYICSYWNNHKNGKCKKNAIRAEFLDGVVLDALTEYVNRPHLVDEIYEYMDQKVSTGKLEEEVAVLKKEMKDLDKAEDVQYKILAQIGLDGRYRNMKPERISDNINKIVAKREELEEKLEDKMAQIKTIQLNKMDIEMVKRLLVKFNDVYRVAPKELRKKLVRSLVKEIQLGYDDCGKVIPVKMVLNFTGEQIELMKENKEIFELKDDHVETVVLLSKGEIDSKKGACGVLSGGHGYVRVPE